MLLSKDGITVDVTHPADIARYKHLGYVEIEVKGPKAERQKKLRDEKLPEEGEE